jgi:plastocyanin
MSTFRASSERLAALGSTLTLALALTALTALLAAPAAHAANFNVEATGSLSFVPQTITITAGDSVTWTNTSGLTHNVYAEDGSFRCAMGCDDMGGDGTPSGNWMFTRVFNTVGTIQYECQIHGPTYGMVGTIVVKSAGSPPPGNLQFSSGSYSAPENAGSITISVLRAGGSAGAVSVHYATSDGTGLAGKNYTATSGTLNWGDGDAAAKTFSVRVLDDGVADGSHTVQLTLGSPQGGANLGMPSMAMLTVTNTDSGGGGTSPAAPSNLAVTATGTTSIDLSWTRNSNNETGFRVQSKILDGSPFQDVLALAPAGSTGTTVTGLLSGTAYGFHVRAENASGNSAYTPELDAATDAPPGTCTADANTLCLGGRFKVTVAWVSNSAKGAGITVPLPGNPDSGLFYFFASNNIEMLIKVLNGCSLTHSYWIFFAATTNVQFTVTVVDMTAGKTKFYLNPLNQAAVPVQDTIGLATCP